MRGNKRSERQNNVVIRRYCFIIMEGNKVRVFEAFYLLETNYGQVIVHTPELWRDEARLNPPSGLRGLMGG